MQRPRRTSEFAEDGGGTATKRQQVRGRRPGSQERVSTGRQSSASRPSVCSSVGRPVTTPQRLPLVAGRVLFTAEKRQNDKKWTQETMQRIMDYLWQAGDDAQAIVSEMSVRGGAAAAGRQMSIKHFVAIVNLFLSFVGGNRYKVSLGNHVDDIVNVMQRLHYPHQLNKSSLKTPSAQHSFHHVVMLLDFLMDFAPPLTEEERKTQVFPFRDIEEPECSNASKGTSNIACDEDEEEFKMPDSEFQSILMSHAEEGFRLWDRQKTDEFEALQQKTTDILIQKRCGLESSIALDVEIKRLTKQLKEIETHRVRIPNKEVEQHQEMELEYQSILEQQQTADMEFKANEHELKQLRAKREQLLEQQTTLKEEVAQLQKAVKSQTMTVAERDKMIAEIDQLHHALQCKTSTVRDLQGKHNQQQVKLSRARKEHRSAVEKFNAYMRDVLHILLNYTGNMDKYLLSINHNAKDLQHLAAVLREKCDIAMKSIADDEARVQKLNEQISSISLEITTQLEPQCAALQHSIDAARKTEQEILQQHKDNMEQLDAKIVKLDEMLHKQEFEIMAETERINQETEQLEALKVENESRMAKAERECNENFAQREAYLDQYEKELAQVNAKLDAFEMEHGELK